MKSTKGLQEHQPDIESIRIEIEKIGKQLEQLLSKASDHERMSVDELVKYTLMSKTKIYKLVKEEQIPYLRVSRRLIFNRVEIDNWITKKQLPELEAANDF